MIANTARSAPKIMHVHCSQGNIGNMNDIMHMKRAISFAAKHTASFFATLNNSISDNLSELKRFFTDKLFKFKQLSVVKRFLTDKHKIPQLRET